MYIYDIYIYMVYIYMIYIYMIYIYIYMIYIYMIYIYIYIWYIYIYDIYIYDIYIYDIYIYIWYVYIWYIYIYMFLNIINDNITNTAMDQNLISIIFRGWTSICKQFSCLPGYRLLPICPRWQLYSQLLKVSLGHFTLGLALGGPCQLLLDSMPLCNWHLINATLSSTWSLPHVEIQRHLFQEVPPAALWCWTWSFDLGGSGQPGLLQTSGKWRPT